MVSSFFQRIADEREANSAIESAAQGILTAFSPFYGAGAMVNRLLHDSGMAQRKTLPAVVFSVGNITLGGTGKTPFCIWLEEWMRKESRRPALITRGYGRDDENRLVLVHDGKKLLASTAEAGDEPVLLARALEDVPIVACANRVRAGRYLLRRFRVDTLILDDAFQHHRIDRQGDIVLVDATRPLSGLRLFPRGTLREPVSVLSRAHLLVITRWQQADNPRRVLKELRQFAPSVPIVRSRITISTAFRLADGETIDLESLRRKKAILLCAVGNPLSVERSAEELGVRIVKSRILDDHDRINRDLLTKCEKARRRAKADFIIVTEKDAVKLAELGDLPESVIALRARVEMLEERDQTVAERVLRARLHARTVKGYLAR